MFRIRHVIRNTHISNNVADVVPKQNGKHDAWPKKPMALKDYHVENVEFKKINSASHDYKIAESIFKRNLSYDS